MKVKTNLRAGSGSATDTSASSSKTGGAAGHNKPVPVYVPPVFISRCAGY